MKMVNENKKKTGKVSFTSDDLLMKPFELGWTREVVKRVISKNRNLNCDIYYFSPSGKKIRSLTEIKSNLTDGLTPECFSFKRQPLGINGSYETVRDARVKRKGNEGLEESKTQPVEKLARDSGSNDDEDSIKTKRRKVLNCSTNKNSSRKITPKESIKPGAMLFTDKYDEIKERTQKAKRLTKSSSQNNNFSSSKKMKLQPQSSKSNQTPKKVSHSKETKFSGNKQLKNKVIRKKVRVSTKPKLSKGKTGTESRVRTKVSASPKAPKKVAKKIVLKTNPESTKVDTKSEDEDQKSLAKDLRSIVKKNIGKYRELREKQKLAIKSQIKTKGKKYVAKGTTRSRSEPISKNKQLYLKPLEKGWRRELVFRKNCAKAGQQADVYYFHPNGKKLRSCREIAENLTQGLTIEYFTFRKEPIGCGEPSEVIREARSKASEYNH